MRHLRFCAEIALLAVSVLLIGAGILGAIVAVQLWVEHFHAVSDPGVYFDHSAKVRRIWTLATVGSVVGGAGLLALYRRWHRPMPWETSVEILPPRSAINRSPVAAGLAALRRLAGGLMALVAYLGVWFGFVGLVKHLFSSSALPQSLWADEQSMLDSIGLSLAGGILASWLAYLLWTDREELDRLLAKERRRSLILSARGSSSAPSRPDEDSTRAFGWQGWLWRFGSLAAVAAILDNSLHPAAPLGTAAARAIAAACVLWVVSGLLITAHELGHLASGALAGLQPMWVRVGRGPLVWHRRISTVDYWLYASPFSGVAHSAFRTEQSFRRRYFLLYAGGPAAHLLALGALFAVSHALPVDGAQVLFGAAVMSLYTLVCGSLVPYRLDQRTEVTTFRFLDAAGMLNAFRLPDAYVRWRVGVDLAGAAWRQLSSPDAEERRRGEAALADALRVYPEHEVLRMAAAVQAVRRPDWLEAERLLAPLAAAGDDSLPIELRRWARTEQIVALAVSGRFADARRALLEELANADPVSAKVERLDRLACLPIMAGLAGYETEALDWMDRALALDPARITLQGTRGSLLVDLGRLDEGRSVLEGVRARSKSENDQGICALYLAIAAREQGRTQEAETLAAEAFKRLPGLPWMAARWARASRTCAEGTRRDGPVSRLRRPAAGAPPEGLRRAVLLAPFTSTMEMTSVVVHLPLGWLVTHRFDNRARLSELCARGGHVWIFSGADDVTIPPAMGRTLATELGANATFQLVPGTGHNNLMELDGPEIVKAMHAARE